MTMVTEVACKTRQISCNWFGSDDLPPGWVAEPMISNALAEILNRVSRAYPLVITYPS